MPVVSYEGKNVHTLRARVDEKRGDRTVPVHINFMFVPGPNNVPQDTWDALLVGSDACKRMVSSRKLNVFMVKNEEGTDEELEDIEKVDIGALDAYEAEKLVETTVHLYLLEKFKVQENKRRGGPRKGVSRKLNVQIDAVKEADEDAKTAKAK